MAQHHIKRGRGWNLLLLCGSSLMIPPLFLRPPVDKSFSFIAQTQGLQVHRPQKRERRGFGGEGVGQGGVVVVVMGWGAGGADGKENGQWGDKGGRSGSPLYSTPPPPPPPNTHTHPGLTSVPTHPGPDPSLHPRAQLPLRGRGGHLSVLLCRMWREPAPSEWCRLALPGLPGCVWQGCTGCRRGTVAMWWGAAAPSLFFFKTSRGAVMTVSYSCAHWGLPYLGLQRPL